MLGRHRSRQVCSVCSKKKIKCDRLVPCGNCSKKGLEQECLDSAKHDSEGQPAEYRNSSQDSKMYLSSVLQFWQGYESHILDIGLFKTKKFATTSTIEDTRADLDETEFLVQTISIETAYKLLEFSISKLGALYFGCIADIGELYQILDGYTHRRKVSKDDESNFFTSDDYYWDSVILSIFTLSVYYMDPEQLSTLFSVEQFNSIYNWTSSSDNYEWDENLQTELYNEFLKCTISRLTSANYMSHPDIRLLQVYIILSSTTFTTSYSTLADGLLVHCFHVAKLFSVNILKSSVNDATLILLTMITTEKIWYRLCICDYLQSGPNKVISFHNEISSLLQQSINHNEFPDMDANESDISFDLLFWKLISLDRDIDHYLAKESRPPLKTLDAIKRQLSMLHDQIKELEETESSNLQFEIFLLIFLLNSVYWKQYKMYFIYYDTSDSFEKSIFYTEALIRMVVHNFKNRPLFNKHPLVLRIYSRICPFYAYYQVFSFSKSLYDINLDLNEVITSLSSLFRPISKKLILLIERLNKLKLLWDKIQISDSVNTLRHPIISILQNDINWVKQYNSRLPSLIPGTLALSPQKRVSESSFHEEDEAWQRESESFKLIITEFEAGYRIDEILL